MMMMMIDGDGNLSCLMKKESARSHRIVNTKAKVSLNKTKKALIFVGPRLKRMNIQIIHVDLSGCFFIVCSKTCSATIGLPKETWWAAPKTLKKVRFPSVFVVPLTSPLTE